MNMYPSKLRFAQDSICGYFRNGSSLQDTLEDLLESDCPEDFFPPMSVMEHQGKYFVTEGNRRLLLLKILESHGLVGKVPVKLTPFNSLKFTTENDGTCIEVRGCPDMEEKLESIVEGEHSEYEDSDETDIGFDDLALSDEGSDSQDDGDEDSDQSEDDEDDESDDDESDDGNDSDGTDDGRGRDDEYADVEGSDTEEYNSEGGDYDDSDSEDEDEGGYYNCHYY